jgi:MOSC domain-containing protein YiiM
VNFPCTNAGRVLAVHRSATHSFSKTSVASIELVAGLGVLGDAHAGATVRHRSRVARDPTAPNLRQIHLIAVETLHELAGTGFDVSPGDLGENITTQGVDLTTLLTGTRLEFDRGCVVEVTGLRNPCHQIETFRTGLLSKVRVELDDGSIERRVGVMGIVIVGGPITPAESFSFVAPPFGASPLVVV